MGDLAALARRAEHFAKCVRIGLDEPKAMRRLLGAAEDFLDSPGLDSLLPKVLDGVLSLLGADFGNVQLLDPATGDLKIVAHYGFGPEFLEYFAIVDDHHSACGRAARSGGQTVIPDVDTDPGFSPHRAIAAASGFRAVQSTPLTDDRGRLVGMVSTHFRQPCRPSDLDLGILELYGDFAGAAIVRHTNTSPADDSGHPAADPQPPGMLLSDFAGNMVNRLFSVGLSLESARSIAGEGAAGDRMAAAVDELDRTIREIRRAALGLSAERN